MMPVDQTHCELSVYIMGIIWCKYGKKSFRLITPEPHFFIYLKPPPPHLKANIPLKCAVGTGRRANKKKKTSLNFSILWGGSGEAFWDT